jgi:hypothetical protein
MQQILRSRDGAKTGVADAVVPREPLSALNHGFRDIGTYHLPKVGRERKEQAPHATPKLHCDARSNPMRFDQREQLLLCRSATTLPELTRITGFQAGKDVGVWVILGKFLPSPG